MKVALFLSALFSAQVLAIPEPDNTVIKDGEYTYTGIDKGLLSLRGLEKRCNCFPECRRPASNCSPGKCECSGGPSHLTVHPSSHSQSHHHAFSMNLSQPEDDYDHRLSVVSPT